MSDSPMIVRLMALAARASPSVPTHPQASPGSLRLLRHLAFQDWPAKGAGRGTLGQ